MQSYSSDGTIPLLLVVRGLLSSIKSSNTTSLLCSSSASDFLEDLLVTADVMAIKTAAFLGDLVGDWPASSPTTTIFRFPFSTTSAVAVERDADLLFGVSGGSVAEVFLVRFVDIWIEMEVI